MSSDIPDHLELLLRLKRRAGVSLERQLLENCAMPFFREPCKQAGACPQRAH